MTPSRNIVADGAVDQRAENIYPSSETRRVVGSKPRTKFLFFFFLSFLPVNRTKTNCTSRRGERHYGNLYRKKVKSKVFPQTQVTFFGDVWIWSRLLYLAPYLMFFIFQVPDVFSSLVACLYRSFWMNTGDFCTVIWMLCCKDQCKFHLLSVWLFLLDI